MALFNVKRKSLMEDDLKYSRSTMIPQYNPSNIKPNISELFNYEKYAKLLSHINNSSVTEEEKKFLRLAASRHIVFNYAKIADYYANSDEEMQSLMEESALVVLDIDDAIANGFVKLSKRMAELMAESREIHEKEGHVYND